jgi:hypothetical protein
MSGQRLLLYKNSLHFTTPPPPHPHSGHRTTTSSSLCAKLRSIGRLFFVVLFWVQLPTPPSQRTQTTMATPLTSLSLSILLVQVRLFSLHYQTLPGRAIIKLFSCPWNPGWGQEKDNLFYSVAAVWGRGHGWTQQKSLVFAPFIVSWLKASQIRQNVTYFVPSHIFRMHNNVRTVAVRC